MAANLPDRASIEAVFDEWDANKDGTISREELKAMMKSLTGKEWTDEQIGTVFEAADADRNGRLDFTELLNWAWADEKNADLFQKKQLSPAEEGEKMQGVEQAATGLKSGQHYFLVGRKWYVEWLEWAGLQSTQNLKRETSLVSQLSGSAPPELSLERAWTKERPGPIDNNALFDPEEPGKLNRGICEHKDYEILSKEEWGLLQSWYGGGPVIKRRAISLPSGMVMIELYGLTLRVYISTDLSAAPKVMTESKTITAATFKKHACEEFGVELEKARVWDYFNKRKIANLESEPEKSLDNCRIYDENDMLLEVKDKDGKWPVDTTPVTRYYGGGGWGGGTGGTGFVDRTVDDPTTGTPPQKGAVGLQNLGNTCFMNSSIQCLSNLPELRKHFLTEEYKTSLNPTAYKTSGKLATAYAGLMGQMWDPHHIKVAPRNFKWQVGQFAEQFAGFGQQDSMEFIEYLLDGLKEDLNKVQGTKPFVEMKEAEDREDKVVAMEAFENYRMRNNSYIDDLFLGLFKSTITCPEPGCGRVSVTFDPYLSVKLSLQNAVAERSMSMNVLVVPVEAPVVRSRTAQVPMGSEPKWYSVPVVKFGTAQDLIEATAKSAGLAVEACILTEVFTGKVYKFFERTDALDRIGANDILVLYELESPQEWQKTFEERWYTPGGASPSPASKKPGPGEKAGIVIYQRQTRTSTGFYSSYSSAEIIGLPILVSVENGQTGSDIFELVRSELQKYIGARADKPWKLFRTSDKWDVTRCTRKVEADDSVLNFDQREYLIVEWPEGAEIPEVESLQKVLKEKSGSGGGRAGRGGGGGGSIDLRKCFHMFTETDQLPETDAWYCNRCKEHREAFKKMEFWSMPPILILQLKRFTYSEWCRDRLDTNVSFPLEGLDLSSYCVNEGSDVPLIYDLTGVSIHMGGMGGGHYIAYGRSSENGRWYKFDDSSVQQVPPATVAGDQSGAYVLFYIRRDMRPPGWGPPTDTDAS